MGSRVFAKRNKIYEFEYSDSIREICKPYRIISNVAWIIVVIALVEPRILLPAFLLSLLMFLTKKMKRSWRVSTFIEKIRNGRFQEAEKILIKLKGVVDEGIYSELKDMLSMENNIKVNV